MSGLIRPKIELDRALMPVLVTLPATLMMILSKMNELAWRHQFPIYIGDTIFPLKVYGKFFRRSRAANWLTDLAEIQTHLRLYAFPPYLQV